MTVNFEKAAETVEVGSAFGVAYTIPRVNLLPPEIAEERAFKRTQGGLALVLVGVLGALGAGFLLASTSAGQAADELAGERAQQATLAAEAAEYAEVPRVLQQVENAKDARATAMSSDVSWYRYLDDLALAYPKDVWLRELTMAVAATEATVAAAPSADPLATPGIGTIAIAGTSMQHSDVATWLDVLAGTEGFADATFSTTQRNTIDNTVVVDYTSSVVVTADALSHRYDREAS